MKNRQRPPRTETIQESWISGHLYSHQSLDPVVRGFVHPLGVSLVKEGHIQAFFFLRYGLGGPHVRLRLRVVPGARESVLAAMRQAAERFLELSPSTLSVDEEEIRQANAAILASDPHETDDSVYPDNSFRVVPFRPEIERYGGPGLFGASLDFFTLSSVAALELLSQQGRAPRSAQLPQAFRLLLQQALGFAADETELGDLLRYGVDSMGAGMPAIVEKGDKVARSQRDAFLGLFQKSVAGVRSLQTGSEPSGRAVGLLIEGSGRLSAAIGLTDRVARAWIGGSQLHMTASRLGLSNAEEVYLSRLLTVTLSEVFSSGGEDLSWLGAKRPEGTAEDSLSDLLAPALAALVEIPASRGA
jgi:hypothetical protein